MDVNASPIFPREDFVLKRGAVDFLAQLQSRLYAAVLSDVLDEVGLRNQAMTPHIRPLDDSLVLVGFARTGLFREVFHVADDENPYDLEIRIIDDLKPGDVVVFGCGGSSRIAPWGELLTTASRARGASGAVMDGFVRDIRGIRAARFPVFHGGIAPLDSKGRGKLAVIDVPIECGGVAVSAGDLVFGDADGVVVVPRHAEEEVLARALAKVDNENRTRDELRQGARLQEVFDRYKVL
ncbi:MAG: RraA family protein [Casimicrobiaceae bacterium]